MRAILTTVLALLGTTLSPAITQRACLDTSGYLAVVGEDGRTWTFNRNVSIRAAKRGEADPIGTAVLTCRIDPHDPHAVTSMNFPQPKLCEGAEWRTGWPTSLACRAEKITAAEAVSAPQPQLAGITFAGGDGSSAEHAVIIKGARSTREGIMAERAWVAQNHPDWRKDRQSLLTIGARQYDAIEYIGPSGRSVIYFDVTEFFGKP